MKKRWAQQQQHFICHLVWLLLLFVTFIFPLFLSIHFHYSSCSLFMILFKSFHGSKTCNIKWTSLPPPPPPVFFFPFRIWHHRENTNVVCVCVYFLCAQAQDRFSLFHPPRWFQFYAPIHTSWKLFIHFYYFFFSRFGSSIIEQKSNISRFSTYTSSNNFMNNLASSSFHL